MAFNHRQCSWITAALLPLFGIVGAALADSHSAAETNSSETAAPIPNAPPQPPAEGVQSPRAETAETEQDKLTEQMIQNIFQGKSEISDEQLASLKERAQAILRQQQEQQTRAKIHQFAVALYALIQIKDLDNIPKLCVPEGFYFENRKSDSADGLLREFTRIFNNPRLQNANLTRVQIFSAEEMKKNFGERPAHLSEWPVDGTKYFSIGQLGDQIIVVLWKESGDLFLAEAIHG